MKYERLTTRRETPLMMSMWHGDSESLTIYNRLAELEDKIEAGTLGDVTEWKEKVECAKRILQIPTLPDGKTDLSYFEYKGERIQDIARQRDEYKHRAEVALRALLDCIKDSKPVHCSITVCSKWTRCGDDACVETRKAMFIEQAEKELTEGRKDD